VFSSDAEADMIHLFYDPDKMGYVHLLHRPLTYIPIDLDIGVFFFALTALLFRRTILPPLAYRHVIHLVLIFTLVEKFQYVCTFMEFSKPIRRSVRYDFSPIQANLSWYLGSVFSEVKGQMHIKICRC
jgi:hypothetical protein